ncbi:MAG TPA: histidinol-phosphate transaminase [Herpetosiphonaceae bacterium]|nr:histidinol-phosphate transaminase [Herpetosiphonaceae bacterium]
MSAVVHGGIDGAELRRLGIRPGDVLDFSSNINPFGPPPAVRQALGRLDPAPYPDRAAFVLRSALASRYGCTPEAVLIGNGSNELIHLIARALLHPNDRVLVVEPTFGEYAHASKLAGATVVSFWTSAADSFTIDIPALLESVALHRPRLVWLCVPNNPTGVTISRPDLVTLAQACEEVEAYLVVDGAYAEMERGAVDVEDALPVDEHVLMLRSLTKAYALAGLRLGCLLGNPHLLRRIAVYQPSWKVNSAAQAAGEAALQDRSFLAQTLPRLWACSDALRTALTALDLQILPSSLPFFLVRVGDGVRVRTALLRGGCLVRDCTSFGLPAYVRVASRAHMDNQRLIEVWRELWQRA